MVFKRERAMGPDMGGNLPTLTFPAGKEWVQEPPLVVNVVTDNMPL